MIVLPLQHFKMNLFSCCVLSVFSIVPIFPLCAFCLNLASGVFRCDFQLCHFHSGLVCSSKQKWHSLPLVLFAQLRPSTTAPFLQLCKSTTCVSEGCVYLHMWWDKNTAQTRFLLLLSCFHTSLSCVLICVLSSTFSAFTLGGGYTIISQDQWWPCPFSFWSWQSAIFSYCTVPHLSFIGFLCVYKCVFTMVVAHIWPLSMSQRGAGLEREGWGSQTGLLSPRLVVIA